MDASVQNSYSRHAHHSSSLSGHESPSASSVGSAHALIPPPSNFYSTGPPPRSLPEPLHQTSNPSRSPVGFGGPEYSYRPYSTASGSPSSVTGSVPDSLPPNDPYGSAGISPTHLSGGSLSAQKRAYRQRRKDPSCDACRERKVKCDATETSSCSECSSRSVKCQFTKETNRRMSSIKQVQDLQNQLADAKQQIAQLRSMLHHAPRHPDQHIPDSPMLSLPALGPRVERGHGPPVINNFEHVRTAMKAYSRGVFKLPPPYRDSMPAPKISTTELTLPNRHVTNTLLAQYHSHMHRHFPMIHWPTFNQEVDQVYAAGALQGTNQTWVAIFFGILACATCQTIDTTREGCNPDVDGMRYLIIAARLQNTWTDNLTLDHSRALFFISTYLIEQNVRSAGWIYLGSAVRSAQDIGLTNENGPWSPLELEARRRLAWSIFSSDRLHSLEGRPLSSYEDDFIGQLGWPDLTNDEWLKPEPHDYPMSPQSPYPNQATSTIIRPVIQMISEMKKILKARVITPAILKTYDDYFGSILRSCPEHYQPHGEGFMDALTLTVVTPLQIARFILYRHNLNIWSQPHERTDAINRMMSVAQDTVRYLKRTMQNPPSSPRRSPYPAAGWQEMLKAQASNLLSRHIWRCTLVLCFRGEFDAALVCTRASSVIGTMRKHNIACGRNLSCFLDRLTERYHRGHASPHFLEQDEEMLAYASGDMQGELETSWIWSGSQRQKQHQQNPAGPLDPSARNGAHSPDVPTTAMLTEKETNDWGGWERVDSLINDLIELQRRERNRTQTPIYHRPDHNTTKRLHLAPPESPHPPPPPRPQSASGNPPSAGASRISIANII